MINFICKCIGFIVGLGSNMNDICGRDWVFEGGDHGDAGSFFLVLYIDNAFVANVFSSTVLVTHSAEALLCSYLTWKHEMPCDIWTTSEWEKH